MTAAIRVEVVYALPRAQTLIQLELPGSTPVGEALKRSGLLERYPEISLERALVGVWGRLVRLDAPLRDGDRVEIYRPLIADPKEARRRRATATRRRRPRKASD